MKTYSASDVATMLNVNLETVRRWIRDGKLPAERAIGRNGSTILMDDIIAFANKPPRAYLLPLEAWFEANGISYEKTKDPDGKNAATLAAGAAGAAGAAAAVSATATTGAAITGTAGVTAGLAAGTIAGAATLGPLLAVPAVTIGAVALMKRRKYPAYTIRLSDPEQESSCHSESDAFTNEPLEEDITDLQDDKTESIDMQVEDSFTPEAEATEQSNTMPLAPPSSSFFEEITQAKQLLDAGIITPEEFSSIKAKLIAKI